MWQNFLRKPVGGKPWLGLVLPLWVLAGFVLAQVLVGLLLTGLRSIGVPFQLVNQSLLSTAVAAVIYLLSIGLVIGLPWLIKKYPTSKEELGLTRLPSWTDIFLAPAGFFVYLLLSATLTYLAMQYLTFINFDQVQSTGFEQLSQRFEYIAAFIALVIIAPFAEEVLFRGYLLGKLRKHVPLWVAILITSLLFGAVHMAWNVGIDVFALSIVLCLLRVTSKSLWPSILLHMLKNGLAFYFLFINPLLLTTMGG